MKNLTNFIQERYLIDNSYDNHAYHPKDKFELRNILFNRLNKDKNADLTDIDVSQITDMGHKDFIDDIGLFENLDPHNIDISKWDVSNVINMSAMFYRCRNFDADLSNWDVSKVTNMWCMFNECENFTGKGLENWNVSKVTNMDTMFYGCKNFEGKGLKNWNVSKVKDMAYMFYTCYNFNCDLNNWDVSKVTSMHSAFSGCYSLKNKPNWYNG